MRSTTWMHYYQLRLELFTLLCATIAPPLFCHSVTTDALNLFNVINAISADTKKHPTHATHAIVQKHAAKHNNCHMSEHTHVPGRPYWHTIYLPQYTGLSHPFSIPCDVFILKSITCDCRCWCWLFSSWWWCYQNLNMGSIVSVFSCPYISLVRKHCIYICTRPTLWVRIKFKLCITFSSMHFIVWISLLFI